MHREVRPVGPGTWAATQRSVLDVLDHPTDRNGETSGEVVDQVRESTRVGSATDAETQVRRRDGRAWASKASAAS
jgi:hypothetical protein